MGTTQKTQQSNQFDPKALQSYQGLQGPLAQMLQGYMQNPFGNPFFQAQKEMGTQQAGQLGQRGMNNLFQNNTASGFGGGVSSPFMQEMQANQGRANTGLQANLGFLSPVQNALGMQQFAAGGAEAYRPLQTGQSQVQSTGGLGSWLPQVAGMALGGLTGGLGGGLGALFGGGGGAGSDSGPGGQNFLGSGPGNGFNGYQGPQMGAGFGVGSLFGGGGGMSPYGGGVPTGGAGNNYGGPPAPPQ